MPLDQIEQRAFFGPDTQRKKQQHKPNLQLTLRFQVEVSELRLVLEAQHTTTIASACLSQWFAAKLSLTASYEPA